LPKTPWIVSSYPGSDAFATFALKKLTCEQLAAAWLIISDLPTGVDSGALLAAGLADGEYASSGAVLWLDGRHFFFLMKPSRPVSERAEACRVKRASFAPG
jgi:hypothetical protein